MKFRTIALLGVLCAASAFGQSTQPSNASAALELRATQAFNNGEYAVALPLLQKLAGTLKDQPDRLAMVQEQIRVTVKNLPPQVASADPAVTSLGSTAAVPLPAPGAPTGADRVPHPAPKAGEVLEMTIKDLGNFDFDAEHGSPIPDDVKRLSGTQIRLHGFMIPLDQANEITQFALVPSLFACCYGQPPQLQHTIVIACPTGKAIKYFADEIVVEGKLNVEVKKDDGFIVSIFNVDASSVKPAAK